MRRIGSIDFSPTKRSTILNEVVKRKILDCFVVAEFTLSETNVRLPLNDILRIKNGLLLKPFFFLQLDLEELRPQFSGDKQPVAFFIVGNAIKVINFFSTFGR